MEATEPSKTHIDRKEVLDILLVAALLIVGAAAMVPISSWTRGLTFKGSCFDRMGSLAEAINLYVASSDDRLPLAFAYDEVLQENRWRTPVAYPAPWARYRAPTHVAADMAAWANATLPFSKNDKNFLCPSTEIIHLPGVDYLMAKPLPSAISYCYNGLMHQLPRTRVSSLATTVLAWEGLGRISLNGYAFANPTMPCLDVACLWTPAGPDSAMLRPLRTMDAHIGGFNVVCADGHARWLPVGSPESPFPHLDRGGVPTDWNDAIFRPDSNDGRLQTRFTPYRRP